MKEVFDGKQGKRQDKSREATAAIQRGIQTRGGTVAGIGAEARNDNWRWNLGMD